MTPLEKLQGLKDVKRFLSPEEAQKFASSFVTAMGGVHTAVGLDVATFGFFGDAQIWFGGVVGFAVWWWYLRYHWGAPLRAVLPRFYLIPMGAETLIYCGVVGVGDWLVTPLALLAFYAQVLSSTPTLLYLACLGYACLCAERAGEKPPSPLDKPK